MKETWDAWPSDEDPWDDYDYYEEEEEDGDHDDTYRDRGSNHDDYQLNDLVDDEITLGWWTSPDGVGGEPVSLYVPDSEVCATTPSADLTPYQSEYEGTWATTATRWTGGTAGPRSWCGRGTGRSRRAPKPGRSGRCRNCGPHRDRRSGRGACRRGVARAVLENHRITGGTAGYGAAWAAGLDAAGTAAMLLEPFRVETVGLEHAGGLAAAAGQYGEQWTRGVIDGWFGPEYYYETGRHEWVEKLPQLCRALHAAGVLPEVARLLAADAWRWMERQAADLDHHRANRGSPATSGDAGLAAGAAAGGGRRRAAGPYRGGAARVRGHRAGVPDAGAAFGGRAADGRASGRWADAVARDCAKRLGAIIAAVA